MLDKAPEAFRTISEVAEDLDLPQHVLRFWETRFTQIKPMKRGGGRRYYRPEDVDLLRGIRLLLYGEGFTIRGVQRLLKDKGVAFVAAAGQNGSVQTVAAERGEDDAAPRRRGRAPQVRQEPSLGDEDDLPDADEPEEDDEPEEEAAAPAPHESPRPAPLPDTLREFLPAKARQALAPAETPAPTPQPAPHYSAAPPPVARPAPVLGTERRRRMEAALDDLIEAKLLLDQVR